MERKRFEAREKIIKSKSFYKFRVGFFNKKKTVEDNISILSIEQAKKINEFNRKKSMTDWALINGVWKNNTVKATTGKYSGYYYIQSNDPTYELFVDASGDIPGGTVSKKTMNGIAVTLNLQLPKKNDQKSLSNFNYGERKATSPRFYSFGLYPKSVASDKEIELERLYNNGNILEGLESTGRWITSNGANKNQTGFFTKYCPEFVYQGERYIRTRVYEMREVDRLGMSMRFSNGKPIPKTNEVVWVKEEPISFRVKNWNEMPEYINPDGDGSARKLELESEEIILGNIPMMNADWEKSLVRAFIGSKEWLEYGEVACDFSQGGFYIEAFTPDRNSQKEYSVKSFEKLADYAFEGCVNLERINLLNVSSESVGNHAFKDCQFNYLYQNADNLLLSKSKVEDKNYQLVLDLSLPRKYFYGFKDEYEIFIQTRSRQYNNILNKLIKSKLPMPFELVKEMVAHLSMSELNKMDFRFFKNDFPGFDKMMEIMPSNEIIGFVKFANIMGAFKKDKFLDNNGQETAYTRGQKTCSWLYQFVKSNAVEFDELAKYFCDDDLNYVAGQNFFLFITTQEGEDKFSRIKMLFRLEKIFPGILKTIMTDFDNAKKYRRAIGENGKNITLSWEDALIKYYTITRQKPNVDEEKDVDEIYIESGLKTVQVNKANRLFDEAKHYNIKRHLLNKPLKEDTIAQAVEKIKNQTGNMLSECQNILKKAYEKQFTYEFLDKRDFRNPILGLYCDCCATLASQTYGYDIAVHSIISSEIQNLIILDYDGTIVAKGTLYVNEKLGYGVFNDFEISDKYKKNETDEAGIYLDRVDSEQEKSRNNILKAFMRGIRDFVEEYNLEHPKNHIKQINVGMGHNRLKAICRSAFKKSDEILHVPASYSFSDAEKEQRVLFTESDVNEESGENE